MIDIPDVDIRIRFDSEITSAIHSHTMSDAHFYGLDCYKAQITSKSTKFDINERIYNVDLVNAASDEIVSRRQTSYKNRIDANVRSFDSMLQKPEYANHIVKVSDEVVDIAKVYVIGELISNAQRAKLLSRSDDKKALDNLRIVYVIDDIKTGPEFFNELFLEFAARLIYYKHLTTVVG